MKPKVYYTFDTFGKLNRASYMLSPQKWVGKPLAVWSVVQSGKTKTLFWNCKFKGQKLQNCFTCTAIKYWNALPESRRMKEQKKDFKIKLIASQIEKYKSRPDFFHLSTNQSWHSFKFISTWFAGCLIC